MKTGAPTSAGSTPQTWAQLSPQVAARWFAGAPFSWWIAGGWAIDLFVGNETRAHSDLDIGVLRSDIEGVMGFLSNWKIFEAKDGELTELEPGNRPRTNVHSLWCRRSDNDPWELELFLDESVGRSWVYRREPRITKRLEQLLWLSASGLPVLAAEVQLLYKAKWLRDKDQQDFSCAAQRLRSDARQWLRSAVAIAHPGHPWLGHLGHRDDA